MIQAAAPLEFEQKGIYGAKEMIRFLLRTDEFSSFVG